MCVARASQALDSVGRACGPHRARLLGEEREVEGQNEKGGNQEERREKRSETMRGKLDEVEEKSRKIAGGNRGSKLVRE